MKCPYAVHRRIVSQTKFEYNEDGTVLCQTTVDNNTAQMLECAREDCGAWQGGRCNYRGVE